MLIWGIILIVISIGCFVGTFHTVLGEEYRDKESGMTICWLLATILCCLGGVGCIMESAKQEKKVTCTEYRIEEVTTMRGDSVANKTYEIYYKK